MYVYIILFLSGEVLAHYAPESESPNVGTVLFKHSDSNSKRWTRSRISLLQARKHFQKLIPSVYLTGTINEKYVANLFQYFQTSYTTVKREVKNPAMYNIMNIALSDALGGYLKLWVLPITKYAYYGGTVSLERAASIFQVYDDIKAKLKTDGRGWRSPNENLLNSVAINIASPMRFFFTRSMKEPCKELTYLEKTDTGLTIPLPVINWNMLPVTLFVPLKNQSLVSVTSPNSSKTLLKYYDIANKCIKTQSPQKLDDFNARFQTWLVNDVAPHLDDDNLYIAFGGILILMNRTKSFYGKVTDALDDNLSKIRNKIVSLRLPINCISMKHMIVYTILLIEIICFIIAVVCAIRSRRKSKRAFFKKCFKNIFKRKPKFNIHRFSTDSFKNRYMSDVSTRDKNGAGGVKLLLKPRPRNLEVDVHFPPYDCKMRRSCSSQSQNKTASEQMTLVNEIPRKSSLKKIMPEFGSNFMDLQDEEFSNSQINNIYQATNMNEMREKSVTSREIRGTNKNMTLMKQNRKSIKQMLYSQEAVTSKPTTTRTTSDCKSCLASGNKKKYSGCEDSTSPANTNANYNERKHEPKKVTYNEPPTRSGRSRRREKTPRQTENNPDVENQTEIHEQARHEYNDSRIESSKMPQGQPDHPLLRIKIDRPETEIKVGITSFRKSNEDIKKPSRIPRLAVKDAKTENNNGDNNADSSHSLKNTSNKNDTAGPMKNLEKRTVDDSALNRPSASSKLNSTL
ncbi:uncharacterized protein LOC116768270 [Danaus plexippus]|uniref:uncharacterized protein LOC116768270 n=1 Tax=Danaus plexippus TaxID=13037 RepID=UPI002AB2D2E1|nr:uncharacterized protein LOC116768270 [Danaus plexippus]